MKYLEMVKIHKNFKQRPHAQLLARGEKLITFLPKNSIVWSVIYITWFVFWYCSFVRRDIYHNENGDFQQETLMFLLLFFQFFTGVKISAFGNLKPDRKWTSPSGFWSLIGIFFIKEYYLIYQYRIKFLLEFLLNLWEMKFLYDY